MKLRRIKLRRTKVCQFFWPPRICSWMFTIACCLVVGLGLGIGLGLDNLVSGWLVVMHTYLYYFRLPLSHCQAHDFLHKVDNRPTVPWLYKPHDMHTEAWSYGGVYISSTTASWFYSVSWAGDLRPNFPEGSISSYGERPVSGRATWTIWPRFYYDCDAVGASICCREWRCAK